MNRCHYISKFIPSLWSRFKLNMFPNAMILKNNIIIETPALTIPELSDDAKDRLDEVWRLSQDGMTPTQISKILNERLAKRKYSDKPYTPKDIGMIKLKYKKRLQRQKEFKVSIGDWKVTDVRTYVSK